MNLTWLQVVGIVVVVAAIAELYHRYRRSRLPSVDDKEFLRIYGEKFPDPAPGSAVLIGRKRVASVLRIQPNQLSPEYDFGYLKQQLSWFGSVSIAYNDLIEEIEELRRDRGLPALKVAPDTVGGVVHEFALVADR